MGTAGAIGVAALLAAAAPGAQAVVVSIPELATQLDSAFKDKQKALNDVSLAAEEGAPKAKEIKLWDEEIGRIGPQLTQLNQRAGEAAQDQAGVNAKVERHNSGCSGTLPRPQYERCKGEEPYLQSEIDRVKRKKAALESEYRPLANRYKDIVARRDALSKTMQGISARYDAAKARFDEASRRIASLTSRLRAECASQRTAEAAAHCGQVDWDGAKAGLGAPNLQPRPFSASANR